MSLHGGNIYDYESPGEWKIIDFSSNINPYGPPSYARSEARNAMGSITRYPDSNQMQIRGAFSGWLGVAPESLVFGNGASELIWATLAAVRPRRLLIAQPTFAEYEAWASRLGLEVVRIPLKEEDGFAFDMKLIESLFSCGDMIVACQPNNPTARVWSRGELDTLACICKNRRGWLLADECFINLTDPPAPSCLDFIKERVIVLRAVTKDFSAPGLRVGFAVANPEIVRRIRGWLQPWPLNCLGEAFAIACARKPEPFLRESRKKISIERARLVKSLRSLGYSPFPSDVNFILVKSRRPVSELSPRLLENGVLIRRCDNFPGLGDSFLRIAVKLKSENEKLLFELARI